MLASFEMYTLREQLILSKTLNKGGYIEIVVTVDECECLIALLESAQELPQEGDLI